MLAACLTFAALKSSVRLIWLAEKLGFWRVEKQF